MLYRHRLLKVDNFNTAQDNIKREWVGRLCYANLQCSKSQYVMKINIQNASFYLGSNTSTGILKPISIPMQAVLFDLSAFSTVFQKGVPTYEIKQILTSHHCFFNSRSFILSLELLFSFANSDLISLIFTLSRHREKHYLL